MPTLKVLIVEDQPAVATALQVLFEIRGMPCTVARSPEEALRRLDAAPEEVGVVLQDMNFFANRAVGENTNDPQNTFGGAGSGGAIALRFVSNLALTRVNFNSNQALAVDSYSWGVSNPTSSGGGTGRANFNDFQVTLAPTALDPALWEAVAAGLHFKQATLTVSSGGLAQPYQTYTFTDVLISSYLTRGGNLQLTLSPARAQEDHATANGKVSAGWDINSRSAARVRFPSAATAAK